LPNLKSQKLSLLLALVLVLTTSGCAEQKPAEKAWKQYFDDAKFLDIQDKREEARSNYEAALCKLPGEKFEQDWRAELVARIARIDVIEGKLDDADKRASEAMQLASDPRAQGPNHGEVLVALDDLAESYSERSYKSKPDKARCLEMAIKILDKASASRAQKVEQRSACELAVEYIMTGKDAKAAPLEKRVIEEAIESKKWTPLRDIAAAYGYVDNKKKVNEYFEKAKELITKKNKETIIKSSYLMELADLYMQNDRLDDAEKTMIELLDLLKPRPGNADMYERLATIYGAKGEVEKAKDNWRLAIIEDTKRAKQKAMRHRLEAYARYLRSIKDGDARVIQQQADGMRDDTY